MNESFWQDKKIVVLGASFIGSHLVDRLIELGVQPIKVVNLTNRNRHYFDTYIKEGKVEFYEMDLRSLDNARLAVNDRDIVFHLAADHGGRGYVDTHQGATASNFLLDGSVFKACLDEKVGKVVFASSGCVYPMYKQMDIYEELYLSEKSVRSPFDADNNYGWAKLMGEKTLEAYYQDFGLKSVILRYFTVYGERAVENHAIIALIAKAFIKQDPYEVWGKKAGRGSGGRQIRNWTYFSDIVEGTLLAAEKIEDATTINLGTMESISVNEAVEQIFTHIGWRPKKIKYLSKKPIGPRNRVANNLLASKLLGWEVKVPFKEGLIKTINWYFKTKKVEEVKNNFERKLMELA